jgi:hypothetical protein
MFDNFPTDYDFWAIVWPVVALDYDGVLNTYDGWTGEYQDYPPREGVREFLAALWEEYYVVIFTARPDENLQTVKDWLVRNHLDQYVNMVTNIKPPGIQLDDNSITFKGNFSNALDAIRSFKPYWHRESGDPDGPPKNQLARAHAKINNGATVRGQKYCEECGKPVTEANKYPLDDLIGDMYLCDACAKDIWR